MRKSSTYRKGFTIIELLIVMGLMSFLMVVLVQVFSTILTVQLESESTSSVVQDGRYLVHRLSYDVHRATSIDIPASIGDTTDILQLTIPEGENDRIYTYAVSDGSLILSNHLGNNALHGSRTTISDFSVFRCGNAENSNTVRVSFDVESVTVHQGRRESETFAITAGVR